MSMHSTSQESSAPGPWAPSPESHVCWLVQPIAGPAPDLLATIAHCLLRRERLLCVAAEAGANQLLASLRAAGVDVDTGLATGQLAIVPADTPDATLARLRSLLQATSPDVSTLVVSVPTWIACLPTGDESLGEFETGLQTAIAGRRASAICLFDRKAFAAPTLLRALELHPQVASGSTPQPNPYYVPPPAALADEADARLEARLGALAEQRRAEAELRARLEQSRALLDESPDPVFTLSAAGRYLEANQAFAAEIDVPLADIIGRTLWEVHPQDLADVRFAQLDAVVRTGEPQMSEVLVPGPAGDRHYLVTVAPIREPSGEAIAVVCAAKETTSRRQTDERQRASEQRYRRLFEHSHDAIFIHDDRGRVLDANQQALDMLGYTMEEYIEVNKDNPNAITPADQRQDALERFQAVLAGEHLSPYERVFMTKNGRRLDVEINLSAVRDASGKVVLVQSVVRDITQRKKAEQILRESRDRLSAANAALERASRMKDEFLASMSHELRTPLTGILGLSEALQLQTYGAMNEKQLKALRNIEGSGRHLLDLINDILDLSKIEAGKLDLQYETSSVAEACQASLQLVKGMAQQKKQHTSFSMDPASIHLRADPRRLKQMLVNLLSNAVKFTPEGGSLGLEVQGNEIEKVVTFCIWDKGIGIKPEDLDRLFKPFVQVDSRLSRQYSGTGLGLSLVQRMAELHGGSIQVESVPGEGSRFTLALPWIEEAPRPEPLAASGEPRSLKNSLVIEDNDLDAEHITRYLQEIGLTNVVHPGLHGALEKAALLKPSVILLDLRLPDGSGMDLLLQLQNDERTRNIPVVITSVEERRTEAQNLGAVGYLVKPFTKDELHSQLSRAAASIQPASPVMVIGSRPSAPVILIADDNEVILETVADFLETKGCRVVATRSGFELIERAPESHPDIVLVDIQMPGMDGLETMRRLRAHRDPAIAAVPIIAITALAMAGDREKCLQAGANEYLSKPIILTQLAKLIDRFLEV